MTNHSHRSLRNLQIAGDWMTADGFLDGRDRLWIRLSEAGTLVDPQDNEPLYLRQYGRDWPVITNGVWTFAPDNQVIDRLATLGVTPQQMIT